MSGGRNCSSLLNNSNRCARLNIVEWSEPWVRAIAADGCHSAYCTSDVSATASQARRTCIHCSDANGALNCLFILRERSRNYFFSVLGSRLPSQWGFHLTPRRLDQTGLVLTSATGMHTRLGFFTAIFSPALICVGTFSCRCHVPRGHLLLMFFAAVFLLQTVESFWTWNVCRGRRKAPAQAETLWVRLSIPCMCGLSGAAITRSVLVSLHERCRWNAGPHHIKPA